VPILAKGAAKIAPGKTEREYPRAGFKVIERLFLDWVNGQRGDKSVKRNNSLSALVPPYAARPETAAFYRAVVGAKIAEDGLVPV